MGSLYRPGQTARSQRKVGAKSTIGSFCCEAKGPYLSLF